LPQRFALWLCLIASLIWMPGTFARSIQIDVAATDSRHIAQVSARHLAGPDPTSSLTLTLAAGAEQKSAPSPSSLRVLPLHDFARDVPELGVVQLPFFYPDLAAVHRSLDGELGERLTTAAATRGWRIVAFWDEGMQVMSGNLAYTHPRALQGREFLVLRDDPMAEKEALALDAWSRRARPDSLSALHKECLVGSRAATLQQILAEQLARVHLDVTLTRHRYEGWVVAMRDADWQALDNETRAALTAKLAGMLAWQRDRAAKAEEAALRELVASAMTAHPLPAETWQTYRRLQPAWESFLSVSLAAESRLDLVVLAATAAGVDVGGGRGAGRASEALPQPLEKAR
jgi:TRAP-type C4-dicarboxylate transport system substrate-binding protein